MLQIVRSATSSTLIFRGSVAHINVFVCKEADANRSRSKVIHYARIVGNKLLIIRRATLNGRRFNKVVGKWFYEEGDYLLKL